MSVTGSVLKSLRCLTPSMSRAISSTPSSTQSAAAATAAKTAESGAKKEKLEFNYKDALNLECRLTEEEVMVRDVFHDYCQVDRWSSCQFQGKLVLGGYRWLWRLPPFLFLITALIYSSRPCLHRLSSDIGSLLDDPLRRGPMIQLLSPFGYIKWVK